ncbi:MAG: tRNA uridine-5-carboxymethylaminomethyl(34) synthesis GTPase MnmE [Rhodospirillaceae bacterium]|nr:MAG: tRNA uridine-5-carboxymethylaminomethyl(34) synthesis GTPase MnmE [Rhodospirillaceae bacterium]
MKEDTIFALASGKARAGIAVLRISGEKAGVALTQLSGNSLPEPRRATRVALCDPKTGDALDFALAIWFPKPASFTGEAVAELHVHGGPAVVAGVLESLSHLPGLRPAEPGEFTRRAFENGQLDLTAVEGLADLVQAETASQRRLALRQVEGALFDRYEAWREGLLRALAGVEAAIDFSDEELPPEILNGAQEAAAKILREIRAHLDDGHCGERLRDGFRIVLLGAPNAGKSTLLNALARREAAIVSDRPGTTRDVIEVAMDIDGFAVTIADTAGLRKTRIAIEQEGVNRAHARARDADLKLVLFDKGTGTEWDAETQSLIDDNTLILLTKCDLRDAGNDQGPMEKTPEIGAAALLISAKTGIGMAAFWQRLKEEIAARMQGSETVPLTRLRHRMGLEDCADALARFLRLEAQAEEYAEEPAEEIALAAEDLRLGVRALGRLTGRVDVEDVLDRLFAEFCIGK